MDIWEFALEMEAEGEKYYLELAQKTEYEDFKKILEDLSADEKRHYEIILSIQTQSPLPLKSSTLFTGMKSVFTDSNEFLRDKELYIAKLKAEQIDVYRSALLKEKDSVALYKKLYDQVTSPEEKSICKQLIEEEERHVAVFDEIIDMLNHVNDWVEAAEFNHRDNY